MADVRTELSSSKMFSKGTEDLANGIVSDNTYNFMSASFKTNEYLEDSGILGTAGPLIYQMHLIQEDMADVHAQISKSQHTNEEMTYKNVATDYLKVNETFTGIKTADMVTASIDYLDGAMETETDVTIGGSLLPKGNKGQMLGAAKNRWGRLYVASVIDSSGSLSVDFTSGSVGDGMIITGSLEVSGSNTFKVQGPTSITGSFEQTSGDAIIGGGLKSTGDFEVGSSKFTVNSSTGTGTFVGAMIAATSSTDVVKGAKFIPKDIIAEIGDATRRISKLYMKSQIIHSGSLHIGTDQDEEIDGVVVTGSLAVSGSNTFKVHGPTELTGSFEVHSPEHTSDLIVDDHGINISSSKLNVTGSVMSSGDAVIGGDLTSTGDFEVGSSKFTVNSSTGTGTFVGAMVAATSSTVLVEGNKFMPKQLTAEIGNATRRISKLYMKSQIIHSGSLHIGTDQDEELDGVVVTGSLAVSGSNTFKVHGPTELTGSFEVHSPEHTSDLIVNDSGINISSSKMNVTGSVMSSGDIDVGGDLTSTGDFEVGSSKFTVAASDGDAVTAGTLKSTGNFTVGSNTFTVNSATGTGTFLGAMVAATSSTVLVEGNKFMPKQLTAEIGDATRRISKLYMKSTIDVSGSLHIQPSSTVSEEDFSVVVSGSIVPGNLDTGSIGTLAEPFKDLYVQSGSIVFADVTKKTNDKDWKNQSDDERKNHITRFGKEELDMLYRGETLNSDGHMSASGDMHVVGTTHLEGRLDVHGTTMMHGTSSLAGHNLFGGKTMMNGENRISGDTHILGQWYIGSTPVKTNAAELNILSGSRVTVDEFNILDGVTSNTAELNLLDGSRSGGVVNSKVPVYGSSGELNATTIQIGGTSITATPAELNKMDGVTVTTANINSVTERLSIEGGAMKGAIILNSSPKTDYDAGTAGFFDARLLQFIEISGKWQQRTLSIRQIRGAGAGHLLYIHCGFANGGTIVHTANAKTLADSFYFASGRDFTMRANTIYQFIFSAVRNQWMTYQAAL